MKLTVVGRYGPFAPAGGCTSGYLIEDNLLLDMGSGVLSRLQQLTDPANLSIILTHFHSDHICDMFIYRYYISAAQRAGKLNKKIDVYMPDQKCHEHDIISSFPQFNIIYVKEGDKAEINGISAKFYGMEHAGLFCNGVTLKKGGFTLGYTADTLKCEGLEKLLSVSDAAICDCAVTRQNFSQNSPHIAVDDLAMLCAKYKTKMLISHLGENSAASVTEEALKYTKDITVLEEMKRYKF